MYAIPYQMRVWPSQLVLHCNSLAYAAVLSIVYGVNVTKEWGNAVCKYSIVGLWRYGHLLYDLWVAWQRFVHYDDHSGDFSIPEYSRITHILQHIDIASRC